MSLTLAQLEGLRSDAFADDIDIDLGTMASWTVADAKAYFESGGSVRPPTKQAPSQREEATRAPQLAMQASPYAVPSTSFPLEHILTHTELGKTWQMSVFPWQPATLTEGQVEVKIITWVLNMNTLGYQD